MGMCNSKVDTPLVEQQYMYIEDVISRDINKHFYGDNIYKIINVYMTDCTKLFVLTYDGPAPCDMLFKVSKVPSEYKKLSKNLRIKVDRYIKEIIKTYSDNFYVGFEGSPPWQNNEITIYYITDKDIKLTNTVNIKLINECVCLTDIIRHYITTLSPTQVYPISVH